MHLDITLTRPWCRCCIPWCVSSTFSSLGSLTRCRVSLITWNSSWALFLVAAVALVCVVPTQADHGLCEPSLPILSIGYISVPWARLLLGIWWVDAKTCHVQTCGHFGHVVGQHFYTIIQPAQSLNLYEIPSLLVLHCEASLRWQVLSDCPTFELYLAPPSCWRDGRHAKDNSGTI